MCLQHKKSVVYTHTHKGHAIPWIYEVKKAIQKGNLFSSPVTTGKRLFAQKLELKFSSYILEFLTLNVNATLKTRGDL